MVRGQKVLVWGGGSIATHHYISYTLHKMQQIAKRYNNLKKYIAFAKTTILNCASKLFFFNFKKTNIFKLKNGQLIEVEMKF